MKKSAALRRWVWAITSSRSSSMASQMIPSASAFRPPYVLRAAQTGHSPMSARSQSPPTLGLDEIVRRAERARRKRQRNWGAALLLLTVTFAGLAALAEFNRREAERNRVEAEKQRDHAEQETIQARKDLSSALTALAFTELEQRPSNAAKLALAAWPRPGATDLPNREVTLSAVFRSLAGLHERMGI